jgi:hypothetical protein
MRERKASKVEELQTKRKGEVLVGVCGWGRAC